MSGYILGVNKYSHSASAALMDRDGRVVFALAKERVTRKKGDGGDVAALLRYSLERAGVRIGEIAAVVQTSHLFRIAPFESRLPFMVPLHYYPGTCLDECNLVSLAPETRKLEMSHHLAHAWAAIMAAPFDEGLVVVMDGMGSARSDILSEGAEYASDSSLPRADGYREIPHRPADAAHWREAETAYAFKGTRIELLFKRWTPLALPELVHNYGFEHMESLGAVYSRAASHIFGDWNACGKVMGLSAYGKPAGPAMEGPLEALRVNRAWLDSLGHVNDWNEESPRETHTALAAAVQANLEDIALDFLARLRERTGARNLVLMGGVALNSQLNGRVAREAGFDQVFVPSAPGDDGAALGCAAFGLHTVGGGEMPKRRGGLSPYLGFAHSDKEIEAELADFGPRVDVCRPEDLLGEVARRLADGQVVGWFQGRGEFGPRALGARSILAHPGSSSMVDRLNKRVKGRESFRPFAPTVLADRAREFFASDVPSPCMSFTVPVKEGRRADIRAVTHVDGTSRYQTLRREENPLYYDLIARFDQLTGLPLLLNTSFNLAGDPIVETATDAVASFLHCDMDALAVGPFLVTKRPLPTGEALLDCQVSSDPSLLIEAVCHADGSLEQATVFVRGEAFACEEVELAVLEMCASPCVARAIQEEIAREGVEARAVQDALARLMERGALRLNRR